MTSNGGDVQLDFGDNLDPTQIEGGEQVLITQELSTDQPVEASEFAALDEDLEALLAALEDDTVDLLDILDATAAGAGPGGAADGGHSFVRLVRIVEDTNPLAFDYGLNALGGPPDEQGGAFALAEVEEEIEPPEPVVIPPSAGSFEASLFDVDTLSSSGSVASGILPVSFGSGSGGSVSFAAMDGVTLQVGGETLSFSWNAATNTLQAISETRGITIFTVELNPTTGAFTVTQVNNLLHGEGMDSALVGLVYTVTSSSGSVTGTLQLTIVDDVPAVSVGTIDLGDLELITFDNETLDGNTSIAGGSVAVAFLAAVNVSYGADGEGSLVIDGYTLSLGNVAHGLTSGGVPIVFSLVNGTVIGSAGGNEVLRIEIDATTGDVTVTQSGPVDHAAQGADSLTLPVGLISVSATVTVTDGDGDTASDSLTADLGGSITIVDDMPAVSVGTIDLGDLELITFDNETLDGNTSIAGGSVAVAFLAAVNVSYGADGEGSLVIDGYTLSLGNVAHGLTSGGVPIVFSLVNGTVIGSAGGNEVLRIEIDATTGDVTVTQSGPVDHAAQGADSLTLPAGLISVTATVTVTDSDHDEASTTASADLSGAVTVLDDVPAVSVGTIDLGSLGLVIDDTDTRDGGTSTATGSVAALFLGAVTATYGADGPGDTEVSDYALVLNGGIDHGLKSGGTALVFTQLAGGDIIATAGVGGAEVLRFSIDDGGQLTITQSAAIDHAPGTDSLTLPAGLISVTATVTVTDSDHDEASTTASADLSGAVTVLDDAPSLTSLNLAIANVAGIYEGIYEFEVGGDVQGFLGSFGEGSLIWTGMPDGYVLTITDSGETWVTYTAKSGSFEFFDLTLNADGTYAFDLLSPAPVVETTIESLLSAFNKDNFFKEGGKDAYLFTADVFDGKFALAVTAYRNGKLEDVSMSSTDLGVKSNVVQGQHNEALRFDVRPVEGQGAIGVSTFTFSVSGTAGSSAGDKATLTVYDVNGSMTVYTAELLAGNGEFVFNIDPTHNVDYMELRPAGNNSFKIDGVSTSYVTQIYPDDYQLDFVLTGSDADGDTATADFSVFVKTTETGSYEITGSDDDDVVHGTAGNDVLIGGAGNDTLIGGEGDDVFQWNLGDQGDNDAPAIDTVVDFGLGNNVLDLADLLQGESLGTIGDFIFAAQEGASTVLYINHEGNIGVDGTNATQVIVLENFTTGEVGSAEILAELLANSQLNVDP